MVADPRWLEPGVVRVGIFAFPAHRVEREALLGARVLLTRSAIGRYSVRAAHKADKPTILRYRLTCRT